MKLPDPNDQIAQQRFMWIQLAKLVGTILMLLGAGNSLKGLVEPRDIVGGTLFVAGAWLGLMVPRLLARRWKSRDDA